MGRHTGPVCRLCRREGIKLYLKATRCTTKCPVERRNGGPGMHPIHRGKPSEYAVRLREKQKVKRYYGVFDRQFRKYYDMASRRPGNTGDALLSLLERRLDNVVTCLHFGNSRPESRQMINHGHVLINGKKVDISSYLVRPGDVVTIKNREGSRNLAAAHLALDGQPQIPDWLELTSNDPPEGRVLRLPGRQDVTLPVTPQLIIELLSR